MGTKTSTCHSNSNDVKRIYGEEDRTTNQLTEEGRMSCDGCCIKVYFALSVGVHRRSIVDNVDVDVKRCTT